MRHTYEQLHQRKEGGRLKPHGKLSMQQLQDAETRAKWRVQNAMINQHPREIIAREMRALKAMRTRIARHQERAV